MTDAAAFDRPTDYFAVADGDEDGPADDAAQAYWDAMVDEPVCPANGCTDPHVTCDDPAYWHRINQIQSEYDAWWTEQHGGI